MALARTERGRLLRASPEETRKVRVNEEAKSEMVLANLWLVNADPAVSASWEKYIRRQGWSVRVLSGVASLLEARGDKAAGMALLDLSCLKPDPPSVLRAIKLRAPRLGLILSFGSTPPAGTLIAALDAGADDHFPHSLAEPLFAAKIRTHLRRLLPDMAMVANVLKAPRGGLRLDRSRRCVGLREACGKWRTLPGLTRTEFDILALLLQDPEAAVERRSIIDALWPGEPVQPGTVDKHVEALRRKLGAAGRRIKTVYGVGYAYIESEAP
jgi:DNA-binding response OmpR family regulator